MGRYGKRLLGAAGVLAVISRALGFYLPAALHPSSLQWTGDVTSSLEKWSGSSASRNITFPTVPYNPQPIWPSGVSPFPRTRRGYSPSRISLDPYRDSPSRVKRSPIQATKPAFLSSQGLPYGVSLSESRGYPSPTYGVPLSSAPGYKSLLYGVPLEDTRGIPEYHSGIPLKLKRISSSVKSGTPNEETPTPVKMPSKTLADLPKALLKAPSQDIHKKSPSTASQPTTSNVQHGAPLTPSKENQSPPETVGQDNNPYPVLETREQLMKPQEIQHKTVAASPATTGISDSQFDSSAAPSSIIMTLLETPLSLEPMTNVNEEPVGVSNTMINKVEGSTPSEDITNIISMVPETLSNPMGTLPARSETHSPGVKAMPSGFETQSGGSRVLSVGPKSGTSSVEPDTVSFEPKTLPAINETLSVESLVLSLGRDIIFERPMTLPGLPKVEAQPEGSVALTGLSETEVLTVGPEPEALSEGSVALTDETLAVDQELSVGFGNEAPSGVSDISGGPQELSIRSEVISGGPWHPYMPDLSLLSRFHHEYETATHGVDHVLPWDAANALLLHQDPQLPLHLP
ncbi:uncharacterized protein LOC126997262 [Eriocheir sinensis]|uniref:uncharacterized protein LOC126997262 n=1 Tax=Eriocheir sinensis TaxID=95602 RepID=UPI0021C783A2|nr:uncharacterized protein LOC126997262 [Eriocheir sinensis]